MNHRQNTLGIIGLIVAIFSCVAAYLALPQIQKLIVPSSPADTSNKATPTSVLSTSAYAVARIEIPGSAQDGIAWCTNSNGIHEIRYESGAYSPWPSDDGCDPKGCWKSTIFVYRNSNPDSVFAGSSKGEPQNPVLQIGWDDWRKSLEQVETASRDLEAKHIELHKNDCLTFIAIDGRDAYHFPSDNRGKVTVTVKLP